MMDDFEIIGDITNIDEIAVDANIDEIDYLIRVYGKGRWRKLKGITFVKHRNKVKKAEIHWYEAHGIGKKKMKIKKLFR